MDCMNVEKAREERNKDWMKWHVLCLLLLILAGVIIHKYVYYVNFIK